MFLRAAAFAGALYAAQFCMAAQVYLWRQSYDEKTLSALKAAEENFEAVNFLLAKISFGKNKTPRLEFLPINPEYLKGLKIEKIACVRIEGLAGSEKDYEAAASAVARLAGECAIRALRGIGVSEIQIDFDCPESKLASYALWLEKIRAALPEGMRLSITAVPSQMDAKGFEKAIAQCCCFTLQIHNLAQFGSGYKIFDFDSSLAAARRADRFGKAFMVALPTYSHFVKFGEGGEAAKVFSENFSACGEEQGCGEIKKISADFFEVARLASEIKKAGLKNFRGEIFFRLPCGLEISNWSIETLLSVAKAEELKGSLAVSIEKFEGGLCEVFVENTGNVDICAPLEIECALGDFRYCEGLNGFVLARKTPRGFILENRRALDFRLPPNQKIKAAWVKK